MCLINNKNNFTFTNIYLIIIELFIIMFGNSLNKYSEE